MSDQTDNQVSNANVSFLDLPDDELGKYSPFTQSADTPVVADSPDAGEGDGSGAEAGAAAAAEVKEVKPVEVTPPAEVVDKTPAVEVKPEVKPAAAGDAKGAATKPAEAQPATAQVEKPAGEAEAAKTGEEAKPAGIDYKAEYEKLTAPFKANGKDITIQSADEAIALMQMGANYNKKMAALKPHLALVKMLETNGLLDEEKLSFLIDLDKKNPAAINKLIKDSGIDPMDLDAEKASGYKPTARKADPRELELDAVLDEIQATPSYGRTLEVVSKQWDAASKQHIADKPQLLKVINAHIQAGIYDLISAEIERERVFGRLSGLSDIEAYRQVGDAIHARGGFAHLDSKSKEQETPAAVVEVTPTPKQVEDDKLKDKKRAASPAKPTAVVAPPQEFNPLALSDDEFNKLVKTRLL